jgi:acid phosphatase
MLPRLLTLAAALVLVPACANSLPAPVDSPQSGGVPSRTTTVDMATRASVPRFSHIVVVVEENHAYRQVIGSPAAPYINRLARHGVVLTRSFAVGHPSGPNYLALFSGSTHHVTNDMCRHSYRSRSLGSQLRAHGLRFVGYAESLPRTGYRGCHAGRYVRRHVPWTNFPNLPARVNKPFSAFPSDYRQLPRVAFVVPNLAHDMHNGTVARGDRWLRRHLARYARWARSHNSLLIVTWDEDDFTRVNRIPGLLYGAHVRHIRYRGRVDHYTMLRTIEAACRLPALGVAANRRPITAAWRR